MKKIKAYSPTPSHLNYLYPGTETLRNKYGITNHTEYETRCAHDTAQAAVNLCYEPLPEKFNYSYLKYIHKRLFEKTFEWAGYPRNFPFTFSDGSIAYMPSMRKEDSEFCFVSGDRIQESFELVDNKISEMNNLKGLSRQDFIRNAAAIFAAINDIHPFREGNGRTQRAFFERLGEAANHKLDFSLVTRARMNFASIQAMKHYNMQPLQHIFEDISNPDKKLILREFIDDMKACNFDVDEHRVIAAQEGETYNGIYRKTGLEGCYIQIGNDMVICKKEEISPELLRTLKSGDHISFTAPIGYDTLIPKEEFRPLTQNEIYIKASENRKVQMIFQRVQQSSKIVYGNPNVLMYKINQIKNNPSLGNSVAQQIERSPESVAKLAGRKCFWIKNQTRKNAERHIPLLCTMIKNYVYALENIHKKITQDQLREQKREKYSVAMPSKELRELFSLSKEQQKDALSRTPDLEKKLKNYMRILNARLSLKEREMIRNGNYKELSESIGTSVKHAKKIAETVRNTQNAHKQTQIFRRKQSRLMMIAS
ncbi:BID domain-containing T4SS effector [Bartonella ancashensis]